MMPRSPLSKPLLCVVGAGLVLAAAASPAAADVEPRASGKPIVAVLPFTSPSRGGGMGRSAEATFVTQLVGTAKLRVIQASLVARMLKRRGLRWTGALDPTILKAAQRWLKAAYVLHGKLRWTGDAYTLSMHVMNVGTLETTMAEDVDFSDARKMRVAVRLAAQKIAGAITGTASGSSNASLFLNVDARAFYDTADACLNAMSGALRRYRFDGTVGEADDKLLRLDGEADNLVPGVPIDIYTGDDDIAGEGRRVTTAYFVRSTSLGVQARARFVPDDGIAVGARASNEDHRWVVAVGRVVDEAEDNAKLVGRFRSALLQKMSEGTAFQQIEGLSTDRLAAMSDRRQRFFAYRKLFDRGIEIVLEGKLYGTVGSRRADLNIYSAQTGKVLGRLLFETRL